MKLFSKLNLLTLALGGVLVLSVPAVKADTTADTNNQQSTATLNIQDESSDITAKLSLDAVPSFPFGTVKTNTIFSGGTTESKLSDNNTVVVNDTRLSSVGWNLAVTNTTAFTMAIVKLMVLFNLHHQHSSLVTVRQKAGLGLKHKLVWNYQVAYLIK